jgi:hypothetical protein
LTHVKAAYSNPAQSNLLLNPKEKTMATGWGTQLTRGEHLVVAELGRRGYVAAPYAGNVPMYDIRAADKSGQAIPIQVKAINGGSWQFDAKHYLNIVQGKDRQKIEGVKRLPNPELLCIFVLLNGRGNDEFYLFPLKHLQRYTKKVYKPRDKSSKIRHPRTAIQP